jgi:cellulose synthase/poly-beta-1,6-N-acetylglucosamine synthase-like glycosyltransferase
VRSRSPTREKNDGGDTTEPKEPSSIGKKSATPETNPHFISILIPTKNSARLLREVLASIGSLDYDKAFLETIVIDALSTDSTVSIAKEFGSKVVSLPANVPSSYNFVLGGCRGDIVAFADSDAILDKASLKILVNRLDEEGEEVSGVAGSILTWNSDRILPRLIGYDIAQRYATIGTRNTHFPTMNVIYRKRALLEVGGFNEKLDVGCDVDLGLRLASLGKHIVYEPRAIVYHIHREDIKTYAKQQFIIGRNVPRLLIDNGLSVRGSRIDTPTMYAEPIIFACAIMTIILGMMLWPPLLAVGGIIGFALVCIFLSRTVRIFLIERRISSFLLPALYTTRLVCWCIGAISFLVPNRHRLDRKAYNRK